MTFERCVRCGYERCVCDMENPLERLANDEVLRRRIRGLEPPRPVVDDEFADGVTE